MSGVLSGQTQAKKRPLNRTAPSIKHVNRGGTFRKEESDFLDRLARISERIQPYSTAAVGIAVAAVMIATSLRILGGWTVADLRFGIYVAAILATGLLAGVPAAVGAAIASILLVDWVFTPPYFAFKWPGTADQTNLAFAALASLITIYFSHCCRVVLRRLHQRELANQTLTNELNHRERNLFSVIQVILQSHWPLTGAPPKL